tara:strand:+ start:2263 stop:2655 length:393 start_codon:yes stop_codon:yes gene_type:complete
MKRRHNKRKYRSGLEERVADFIKEHESCVRYEEFKIKWTDVRFRVYTPDFVLDNGIIIETKGLFTSEDRRKHTEVQKQHPELDIRFVFTNERSKLYKGSKTTYAMWCEKNNLKYATRVIPLNWLKEKKCN